MAHSSIGALLLAAALAAAPAGAQVTTDRPIRLKAPKPRIEKFKGEVVNANIVQITVRSRENARVIRTFSLSEKARQEMQKIMDRGGYHYGDKVEIEHEAGKEVAIKIKGKPSKPH